MTQGEAILRAVIEEPEDDAHRLVYADWCEDNDDPARAEFIRVQIELARLAGDDDRYSELQARERRLYAAHGRRWQQGVPYYAIFRRGFVDELWGARPEQFRPPESKLLDRHPVRSAWVSTQEQAGWGPRLAACPPLARLRGLSLRVPRSHHVAAADLLAVTGSRHLTALRALDIGTIGGSNELDDATFAEMVGVERPPPAFTALRYLGLGREWASQPNGDGTVAVLTASPLARTLTHLDLSGGRAVTPSGLRRLFDSPLWPRLEELNLSDLGQGTADAGELLGPALARSRLGRLSLAAFVAHERGLARRLVEALTEAPSWAVLRSLDLSRLPLGGGAVRVLARCPQLKGLSRLDLGRCDLTDEDLECLAGCPYLGGLTALELDDNPEIGNAGADALARSPHVRRLAYLNLSGTGVTGAGVASLARSTGSARLRVLVLPMSAGDAGLKALAGSPHAGRLTTLVRGAGRRQQRVTDAGVQALVGSPHLCHLTALQLHAALTKTGQQALLEAEHIAWTGLSEYDIKSRPLKSLHAKRWVGCHADSAVLPVEPFFAELP